MRCSDCGTSTTPRWVTIRGIRVPICSCKPRHYDLWWICHCDECIAYRKNGVAQQWLDDYNRDPEKLRYYWLKFAERRRQR